MKFVILMRTDLGMSVGKMVAQTAHLPTGAECATVALGIGSQEELIELHAQAVKAGLPSSYIMDAGKTEVPPGTYTCASIGPASAEDIDKITGHLKKL